MRNHSTWEYCSLPPRRQLPGWNASPSQGYPQQYVAGTYLYTWMQRDNVEQSFSCLRKQAAITTPQLKPGKSDKAKFDAQNIGNTSLPTEKKRTTTIESIIVLDCRSLFALISSLLSLRL